MVSLSIAITSRRRGGRRWVGGSQRDAGLNGCIGVVSSKVSPKKATSFNRRWYAVRSTDSSSFVMVGFPNRGTKDKPLDRREDWALSRMKRVERLSMPVLVDSCTDTGSSSLNGSSSVATLLFQLLASN